MSSPDDRLAESILFESHTPLRTDSQDKSLDTPPRLHRLKKFLTNPITHVIVIWVLMAASLVWEVVR